MKFYFLHMNSDEVGTPLKHPETINGNVKNLSKRMKMKNKGNANFYFKNLTLPLMTSETAFNVCKSAFNPFYYPSSSPPKLTLTLTHSRDKKEMKKTNKNRPFLAEYVS